MALLSITQMETELSRRLGVRPELTVAQGSTVIELAINNAYQQTVLKYKHTEFEATPPFFIAAQTIVQPAAIGAGNNPANSFTFTTTNVQIGALVTQITDGFFNFDDEPFLHTVTRVRLDFPAPGIHTVTVVPRIQQAHVNAAYKLYVRRYPMAVLVGAPPVPKVPFYIIDITDITNNIKLRAMDIRTPDRSVPLVGQATIYDRVNNELYLYPAPFDSSGGGEIPVFRLRYIDRPDYKSGADTLNPLPEEWQEVVMLDAQARVLESSFYEIERATLIRDAAVRIATEIMKPYIEETDDQYPALIPRDYFY